MGLIKIETNENQEPVISGRELHEKLGVETPFKKWMDRMLEYGFTENIDFVTVGQKCPIANGGYQERIEYLLKLDTAKEICMLQRNEKGKEFRKYFIEVEKEFNSPEKIMARALKIADDKIKIQNVKIEKLEQKIEDDRPKVILAQALQESKTSSLIGELAKLLKQNGIDIGANRLFEWLRVHGYLGTKGENYNIPTQKSMNLGIMEIKTTHSVNRNGSIRINRTPKITGKGQTYFVNKFLNKEEMR